MPLNIHWKDARILVIEKPAGFSVYSENQTDEETVADLLRAQEPGQTQLGERAGIVHRLDKETSGLLLVARDENAFVFLQRQFREQRVEKRYTALAEGRIEEETGTISAPLGRAPSDRRKRKAFPSGTEGTREAVTGYRVIRRFRGYTLLEMTPKTGRTHQIRAHLAYLRHPLAGDKLYGFKDQRIPQGLSRHFLHASYLRFPHPDGETQEVDSELPEDLRSVLASLEPDEE